MVREVALVTVLALSYSAAAGQPRAYPPQFEEAKAEVFKTIGGVKLKIHIFAPEGHRASDKRAAIVFFFGGGWKNGNPRQFEQQCRYLASRGMVAMTADYRVRRRHEVTPVACVQDCKSAVRWVRKNARRLGIDPDRIAAGGGSAGGHTAACTGVVKGLDEKNEDASISSRPNAMVLFNPVMALAATEEKPADVQQKFYERMKTRIGSDPKSISPWHHVGRDLPPTIMFFGTNDALLDGARKFHDRAKKLGAPCELITYDGRRHGFFNFGRNNNKPFIDTMRHADRFLTALGYLEGEPTIEKWTKRKAG